MLMFDCGEGKRKGCIGLMTYANGLILIYLCTFLNVIPNILAIFAVVFNVNCTWYVLIPAV